MRKRFCRVFFAAFLSLNFSNCVTADPTPIDYAALETALQSDEGLVGWIHASVPDRHIYIFTWRSPDSFFVNAQFPLTSRDPEVQAQLAKLVRHDKVRVKGQYARNNAPQRHIAVQSLEIIKKYESHTAGYDYQTEIPRDLEGKTELIAKVHAVDAEGSVLIIEYGDSLLPVFVKTEEDKAVVAKLYRGDKIELKFVIRRYPNQPVHLSPDESRTERVIVKEELVKIHGQPADLTGVLVKFPESPQVKFDVYALEITDADNVTREYTLLNAEDVEAFAAIRKKLAAAFDSVPEGIRNGRNKLVNDRVKVRAVGIFNVVDPGQANPQIFLNSAADLDISLTKN